MLRWGDGVFIKGLNHLLFSVSDLDASIKFYQDVFDAKLLVKGNSTAYFDLNGVFLLRMLAYKRCLLYNTKYSFIK